MDVVYFETNHHFDTHIHTHTTHMERKDLLWTLILCHIANYLQQILCSKFLIFSHYKNYLQQVQNIY